MSKQAKVINIDKYKYNQLDNRRKERRVQKLLGKIWSC